MLAACRTHVPAGYWAIEFVPTAVQLRAQPHPPTAHLPQKTYTSLTASKKYNYILIIYLRSAAGNTHRAARTVTVVTDVYRCKGGFKLKETLAVDRLPAK